MTEQWIDACGRHVTLPQTPQRIICLCPSLTETLFELGLGERIVGRTRYCIHPAANVASVTAVGGTKQMDFGEIKRLQPDLIIAEKEENRREDVEALDGIAPVYVFDIQSVTQATEAIRRLAAICGLAAAGESLAATVDKAWAGMTTIDTPASVVYLIWRKPWMAAGQTTYIDSVLNRLGLNNLAAQWQGRYPALDIEQLQQASPDICLLSSEPYPFANKHLQELQSLLPSSQLQLVDGEMFSWYGSRMLSAARYLNDFANSLANKRLSP